MNQAIQCPEHEWWDEELQSACFIALIEGFRMICAVRGEASLRRFKTEHRANRIL